MSVEFWVTLSITILGFVSTFVGLSFRFGGEMERMKVKQETLEKGADKREAEMKALEKANTILERDLHNLKSNVQAHELRVQRDVDAQRDDIKQIKDLVQSISTQMHELRAAVTSEISSSHKRS